MYFVNNFFISINHWQPLPFHQKRVKFTLLNRWLMTQPWLLSPPFFCLFYNVSSFFFFLNILLILEKNVAEPHIIHLVLDFLLFCTIINVGFYQRPGLTSTVLPVLAVISLELLREVYVILDLILPNSFLVLRII